MVCDYFLTSGRFQQTTLTPAELKQHHDDALFHILNDNMHSHLRVMLEVDMPICQVACKDHKVSTPDTTPTAEKIIPERPVVNWSRKGHGEPPSCCKQLCGWLPLHPSERPPSHMISSTWQSQSKLPKHLPPGHTSVCIGGVGNRYSISTTADQQRVASVSFPMFPNKYPTTRVPSG
jgi:hypothetical protein